LSQGEIDTGWMSAGWAVRSRRRGSLLEPCRRIAYSETGDILAEWSIGAMEVSHPHYTVSLSVASVGVVAVTAGVCQKQQLPVVQEPLRELGVLKDE